MLSCYINVRQVQKSFPVENQTKSVMSYFRNTWYVAAWDHEVNNEKPLARKILEELLVLFRDSEGTPQAIADRCPHRFAPLSRGCIKDNSIQCAYHGLKFDGTGQCIHNPHGEGKISTQAKVKSYPVIERHSIVWIWMGDPAKADPNTIIDYSQSLDAEKRFVAKDYLHVRANYQLETDNIMDLSHIQFLHPGSLGSDAVNQAITEVVQEGNTVFSNRLTQNERLHEDLEQRYNIPKGQKVDRWLDVRWDPPANMELWVGVAPAGTPEPRKVGKRIPFNHFFTPETANTAHYWFATSYPRRMGEEGERRANEDIKYLRGPFEAEDLPMLEAQQKQMGEADFWSLKPILLPGDAAAVRARRVLDKLTKQEQEAS
jgi:phenylpropionate dioxygenase-like ring-hydroxylating dioxygenase large terminal subunit